MGKELVRNGGFERGNLDFWLVLTGNVEVQSDVKKHGTYAAKIYTDNTSAMLYHDDYVSAIAGSLYRYSFWYRAPSSIDVQWDVLFYDSDRSYIGYEYKIEKKYPGIDDWKHVAGYFVVPEEASYLSIGFVTAIGTYTWFLDSVSLQQITPEEIMVKSAKMIEIKDLAEAKTGYSDILFTGIWETAEYSLLCSSLTGTSPTLDVWIQGRNHEEDEWREILAFQRITTGDKSEHKTVVSGLGCEQRVKYTTGGTVTDCDFKVLAVFKR